MADTDSNGGSLMERIGVMFGFGVDKKGEKETKQSTTNMIGLISDLAIIGKVAGTALSKMWSGVQKTIKAGTDQFGDVSIGLKFDVDPDEMRALKYSLSQINVDPNNATKMLSNMDALRRSFTSPETGEKEMVNFIEKISRYGVTDELSKQIIDSIENNDLIEAIKLAVEARSNIADPRNQSNLMSALGLDALGSTEIEFQYQDWLRAWQESTALLTKVNTEGLDGLADGAAKLNEAMNNLTNSLGGFLGGPLDELGKAALEASTGLVDWVSGLNKKRKDIPNWAMDKIPGFAKLLNYEKNPETGEWESTLGENKKSFSKDAYRSPKEALGEFLKLFEREPNVDIPSGSSLSDVISGMEGKGSTTNMYIDGVQITAENLEQAIDILMDMSAKEAESQGVY